jgi:hypothetical protein
MKRLTVVAMMIALATFVAATGSAEEKGWGAIHGTYAMSATANCLHWWEAGGPVSGTWGASNMVQGFVRFESDGKGTAWGNNWPITPPQPSVTPVCGNGAFSFDFTYTVTHEGAITVWMTPDTFVGTNLAANPNFNFTSNNCGPGTDDRCTLFGMVSRDHKTMSLATAASPDGSHAQGYLMPNKKWFYANCSIARILFRVGDLE